MFITCSEPLPVRGNDKHDVRVVKKGLNALQELYNIAPMAAIKVINKDSEWLAGTLNHFLEMPDNDRHGIAVMFHKDLGRAP